jgi:hypothetical protein
MPAVRLPTGFQEGEDDVLEPLLERESTRGALFVGEEREELARFSTKGFGDHKIHFEQATADDRACGAIQIANLAGLRLDQREVNNGASKDDRTLRKHRTYGAGTKARAGRRERAGAESRRTMPPSSLIAHSA